MNFHKSILKVLILLFLCSNAVAQKSDSLKFTSFEIPAYGSLDDMNDQGEIIGVIKKDFDPAHGFIRRVDGEMVKMDNGEMTTNPSAINNNGVVLGTFIKLPYDSYPVHSDIFMLASDGQFNSFPAPSQHTIPTDINDANVITGYISPVPDTGMSTKGFVRYPDGEISQFNARGYMTSLFPKKINKDGTIMGITGANDGVARSSFVRTPQGAITEFKVVECDGCRTRAVDMNDNGIIVGEHGDRDNYGAFNEGFIRQPDSQMTRFSIPNGEDIKTAGINNDNIIVGSVLVNGVIKGFIRKPDNSMTIIQYPDAKKTWILGINNHGLIFGEYVDQDNKDHGFLLDIN
jgi:hypothetical protein